MKTYKNDNNISFINGFDAFIKATKYRALFLLGLLKYRKKKVKLSFLEVWVGQTCTIKCRDCMHLIPYVKPCIYDVDKLIEDCKKVFCLCDVDFFSIVGGEPFINKQLYKLLDFVAQCDNIKDGKLITNGTIMPDERTLESIKNLHGKLDVRIDVYPGCEERADKFYNLMQKHNIRCAFMRHTKWDEIHWKCMSSFEQKMLNKALAQKVYLNCSLKSCHTLANGELTVCPRGITTQSVFGLKKNRYENILISQLKDDVVSRAKIATGVCPLIHKDYCRFCFGTGTVNPFNISAGIQLGEDGADESLYKV